MAISLLETVEFSDKTVKSNLIMAFVPLHSLQFVV